MQPQLHLDARNPVGVGARHRIDRTAVDDVVRDHRLIRPLDVAPIVLGGDADRNALDHLPADAQLHLRQVALAGVKILHAADIAPHVVALFIGRNTVADAAVRRQAESQSEPPGQRQLKGDVVEIERIVARARRGLRTVGILLLAVVKVDPLHAEIEEKSLAGRQAVRRRIERIDHHRAAHPQAYASHRPLGHHAGRLQFADAVHRIGRKGIDTACLSHCRNRHDQHRSDSQSIH